MKEDKNSKKTYGVKGERYLDDVFKDAIGVGVNKAFKYMMDDVKNMEYGTVYDTHILVNHINLRELTQKLDEVRNRRENLKNELTILDESEKELEDAISNIQKENREYEENKKKGRNMKLNDIANKVLIEYDKNRKSFDSMDILRIVDDSEVGENMNIVVGYLRNTLKSLNNANTVCLHENRFDDGYRIKLERDDVNKLVGMLDDLRF
ncbi:MAG: hypothetical protein E7Z75_09645 [Methanobrevibacter olleyae]|uniref:Uncharacterized protein n=1 Tax=Methanobrevibacter olleyae TaxID=294671 RepID=A0A8T3VVV0_METOL|nr:hypothetical protein [Methanobrevibacter olleyae]